MAEMQTGCLSSKLAMNHLPSHPLPGGSEIEIPLASSDPRVPLYNLSVLDRRIDTLRRFLSRSLETRASIGDDQIDLVSKEIASSVQHIILNGAALLGTSQNQNLQRDLGGWTASIAEDASDLFAEKVNELTTVKSMMPPDLRDLTGESRKPADLKKSFHSDSRNLTTPADQGALAVGDGNLVDLKVLEKSINSRKLRGNMAEPLLPYLDSGNMKVPADQGIPAAGDGNLLEKSGDSRYFSENIADHKIPVCSDSKILKITADQVFSGAADGNLFDLKFPEDSRTSRKLRNPADGNRLEEDDDDAGAEIIELDSVELLAEHMHFCEICGKGFKRDANLRMHKRAHGNQFKTLEALSKPDRSGEDHGRKIRFSCPFEGCNRNKSHKRFRPLKSAVCVKNHFKRSHCPKMYSCNRCNKKSFSVVSDLKSHLKHCGESRWRCSCGTTFSRKDKLFGHVALFEGHMPAIVGEEKSTAGVDLEDEMQVDREGHAGTADSEASNSDLFEGLLQGFGAVDASSLNDLLGFL